MPEDLKYKDYLEHYRIDAEEFDYFSCDYPSRETVEKYKAELVASSVELDGHTLSLDVGCGGGTLTAEIVKTGAGVVGVDLSRENLKRVRERVGSENFCPVVADIHHLPFREGSFGVIFLSSLLEHLELPEKALRESVTLLRERGYVVIIVPYKEKIRYHLCIHCNRPTPGFAHLHSFDETKLLTLLEASGLKAVHRERFANKLLDFFAACKMLRSFPFGFWRTLDKLLNLVLPRMEFLLVVAKARKQSDSV